VLVHRVSDHDAPNGQIARVGDVDGDRRADVLFRLTNGDVAAWFMDGTTIVSSGVLGSVDSSWVIQ
jgi:hypothetical protein